MSQAEVETLRDLYAAWARGDFTRISAFAEDIEFVYSSDFPEPGTYTGIPAPQEGWRRWLSEWRDVSVVAEEIIEFAEGEYLVLARIGGRASGASMAGDGANIWRFRDGKAVSLTLYADRKSAQPDAGL